jgi:hypothetical protein
MRKCIGADIPGVAVPSRMLVRTFCTVQGGPAGPLAPPTRRARLRSRWRSRTAAPTPVGWRESRKPGPPLTYSNHQAISPRGVSMLPLPDCPGRAEPVKAVRDRRATASDELPGERTREDGLDDRTCPAVPESAVIGGMGTSGQDALTLSVSFRGPGGQIPDLTGAVQRVGRPPFDRCSLMAWLSSQPLLSGLGCPASNLAFVSRPMPGAERKGSWLRTRLLS